MNVLHTNAKRVKTAANTATVLCISATLFVKKVKKNRLIIKEQNVLYTFTVTPTLGTRKCEQKRENASSLLVINRLFSERACVMCVGCGLLDVSDFLSEPVGKQISYRHHL